jgi:hypothetical protein
MWSTYKFVSYAKNLQDDIPSATADPIKHALDTDSLAQILSYGAKRRQAVALFERWLPILRNNYARMLTILVEAKDSELAGAAAIRRIDQHVRANASDKMLALGPVEGKAGPAKQAPPAARRR